MDPQKEKFLRNEFLTMSILGALGRSKTFSESATEEAKNRFRNTLREKLDEVSKRYESSVTEKEHLANIKNLSDDLTLGFSHCLRNGRFRIGIAQKALNLYLKYLWCVNLVTLPPHCPFDSIVISYIPECSNLNWTSIDTIEDYQQLVNALRRRADGKPIAEWELEIWLKKVQSKRKRWIKGSLTDKGKKEKKPMETLVEFTVRLERSVNCYSHPCKAGYFALKKVNTMDKRHMGVFAYVLELRRTFRVDVWKDIADRAAVSQFSDGERANLMFGIPGVFFFVGKNSNSEDEDYRKAVNSLRAVLHLR